MKIFGVLILVAAVSGKPSSEELSADYFNGNQFEQDGRWEDWGDSAALSGSSEELALASGDWRMEALDYTNKLRAKAGLKPYKLDSSLSAGAQAWAENTACSEMDHDYSLNGFSGENLATAWSDIPKGESARKGIDMWYNEHQNYTCQKVTMNDVNAKDPYYEAVGHFMNIMAKDLSMVGFGMAFCPQKEDSTGILVARYHKKQADVNAMYWAQLKKQGTKDINQMDLSAMVPCTNTFTP